MADAAHAKVLANIKAVAPPESVVAPRPALRLPDLGTICAALPGKYKRLPTYLEPLDGFLNGGLQTGRLVVIGGPPGVTKTGLTLALSYEMTRRGAEVSGRRYPVLASYIAADEPRDGCLSRLAQIEGLTRADLDNEDTDVSGPAWRLACERIGQVEGFTIWDPREDTGVTVEAVAKETARIAAEAGGRPLVIVDSLQLAPFDAELGMDDLSLRERTDAKMKALRKLTITHGVCFIVLSELNRGGYGQGRSADLASFKESSGIEYGVDVGCLLSRVKDETGFVVEMTIVKNRLGDSDVKLRLERTDRCTFRPIAMPDEESLELARVAKEESDVDRMEQAIVKALLASSVPVTSRPGLLELVQGANEIKSRAVTRLQTSGRLTGGRGQPFRVVTDGGEQ